MSAETIRGSQRTHASTLVAAAAHTSYSQLQRAHTKCVYARKLRRSLRPNKNGMRLHSIEAVAVFVRRKCVSENEGRATSAAKCRTANARARVNAKEDFRETISATSNLGETMKVNGVRFFCSFVLPFRAAAASSCQRLRDNK